MKKFILAILLLPALVAAQGTIPFTPAVIFNGDQVRTLRNQIDINGIASIRTGSDDPSLVSVTAPKGSIYLRIGTFGGTVFTKQDSGNTTNWTTLGGGGGGSGALYTTSSFVSPITITAAGGISTGSQARQLIYTNSSGGAVPITANPQISAGITVGQELVLYGTSPSNYIILANGSGISINGPIALTDNSAITLIWNGTVWSESSRR